MLERTSCRLPREQNGNETNASKGDWALLMVVVLRSVRKDDIRGNHLKATLYNGSKKSFGLNVRWIR